MGKEKGTPEPCAPPCPAGAAVAASAAVPADAVGVQRPGVPLPVPLAQPEPPTGTPLSDLRTLVREAFDVVPRAYANCNTGELGRISIKRIAACLEEVGAVPDADLLAVLVQEERYRRKEQALRDMATDGLRAELRLAEAMIVRAKKRTEDPAFWSVWAAKVQAVIRQRPAAPEPVKAQRRKGGIVRPDQRAAAVVAEQQLLDLADVARGRGAVASSCAENSHTSLQPPCKPVAVSAVMAQPVEPTTIDVQGIERPNTAAWRMIQRRYAALQHTA